MTATSQKVAGGVAAGTMWINASLESLCDIFPANIVHLGAACSALLALTLSVCHIVKAVKDSKQSQLQNKKLEIEIEELRAKQEDRYQEQLRRMEEGEALRRCDDIR